MSIGSKPTEWEANVSSNPSCLTTAESAKIVQKILSTAGSRAIQKQLYSAIQSHVKSLTSDEHGCSILSSLIRYGTKQTVSKLLPDALAGVIPKNISTGMSDLVRFSTGRPGCSEEADAAVSKVVKVLIADPSLPNAIRAIPFVAADDLKFLSSQPLKKAFKNAAKVDRNLFVKSFVQHNKDSAALGALWTLLVASGVTEDEAVEVVAAGRPVVDVVSKYVLEQGKASEWVRVTGACIRLAGEAEASAIVDHVLSTTQQQPALVGAIQSRFPDRAFNSPELSASATQWTRSHQSAFHRTRETVQARIAQKRPRDDADEF